ncbi:nuclear transport factor 2 family protein [Nocardia sp. NPDC057663]|uniref:nuclear transport factor 2 family protein n=1 Tax=Nocardia sp. NPDC057663 TaxID=3346201 RepID=UPI00367194F8
MDRTKSTTDLEVRVARLEAVEAVRGTFARYTQLMDGGFVDELLDVFATDADFLAENEPPGSGGSVDYRGRSEIAGHYRALPYGWFRHHTTNTTVDVSANAQQAELSSYFLTTFPGGVQGGLYEGSFALDVDGVWRIRRWQITSSWGWGTGDIGFQYFEPLAARTLRGGRPVVWNETLGSHGNETAQESVDPIG